MRLKRQIGNDKVHAAKYVKVLNGRKQPIRGLWERNGKFIARIAMEVYAGKK